MKKTLKTACLLLFLGMVALSPAMGGPLQIGPPSNCNWKSTSINSSGYSEFSLPGSTGTGFILSGNGLEYINNNPQTTLNYFNYTVDLSGITEPGHCVKFQVYFGTPITTCSGNQIEAYGRPGGMPIQSATLLNSTVTVTFGSSSSPCLQQGQVSDEFGMYSDQDPKWGYVTIIDDYVNPVSGVTNHFTTNVTMVVPDIPPFYLYPYPPVFQGVLRPPDLSTNPAPTSGNSGIYDLGMQLYSAVSNGLPIGPLMTQSITVSNGLFSAPMNFDPSVWIKGQRWLSLSIRPAGSSNAFTTLNPPQPVSPTPQAVYAFTAGTVADLSPGQAVKSLNGITDAVILQAGSGITFNTNGNTLVINSLPAGFSDRHLKTNFATINPQDVLRRVVGLPVQTWSYTNEQPDVRHMGPMAQDFRDAFKLGDNDKLIGYLDETGVALAAIQGLNQKLLEKDATLIEQTREIRALKARLELLESIYSKTNQP